MRLNNLERGHRLRHKFMLGLMRMIFGGEDAGLDLVKMLMYRPEFFGRPFGDLVQSLLRGQSEWSVGERELLAAFTSKLNECSFCTTLHGAVATEASDRIEVESILTDWRTAPLDDKMRAMLGFLEKMAHMPEEIGEDDAKALRASGLTDPQIEDAIHISASFHIINRLADSFDVRVPSPERVPKLAKAVLKRGYQM